MIKETTRNDDKSQKLIRLFGMVTFGAVALNVGLIATAMVGYF